jgi:NADH dehydrogenase
MVDKEHTMEKKRIVVLGGGYAGVHAAKRLHKAFKKNKDQVEITLIDRHKHHILMTELHEVAGNRVDEASVKISFDRIFSGKRVNVVRDEITTIDFKEQVLHGVAASYPYDQIIIATGAESTDFNIPGVKEHAFYLWSLQDALDIKRHITDTVRAASYEKDPEERKEMLTFVVAGGGFTGVELVGELIEWLPILCKDFGVDYNEVTLMNVEALGNILNMLPDKPRNKAIAYMKKKGVIIRTQSLIVNADEKSFTIKDGTVIKTRTLVWTCGVRGTSFCNSLDLADGKVQRKKVDQFMKSPDYDNVYLAGDGIWFMEDGRPVPQIVEAAEQTAATAADGVIYTIKSELGLKAKPAEPFKSAFHGYMVSIGGRYAVSFNMGMAMSGFFAQAVKHLVNMYYQFGVCGVNGVWAYFKHEILNIKHKRSLIGGLATWKPQAYWMTFLRMYLGVMWLIEGITKITEGWLTDTTGGKIYWGAPAGATGDAVSAASGAAEPVVEAVTSASTAVATTVASSADAVVETVKQFAPPLLDQPLGLYTWMNDNLVAAAPYFFQIIIVLAEVGIGLCFIGGLLTAPAAVVSLGLSFMFLIGALAGKEILWYMAVSIVMIGGAGRAFGLDYWVMPWLKKTWNKIPLAKKIYFFMDEPEFTKKQMERKLARNKDITV